MYVHVHTKRHNYFATGSARGANNILRSFIFNHGNRADEATFCITHAKYMTQRMLSYKRPPSGNRMGGAHSGMRPLPGLRVHYVPFPSVSQQRLPVACTAARRPRALVWLRLTTSVSTLPTIQPVFLEWRATAADLRNHAVARGRRNRVSQDIPPLRIRAAGCKPFTPRTEASEASTNAMPPAFRHTLERARTRKAVAYFSRLKAMT